MINWNDFFILLILKNYNSFITKFDSIMNESLDILVEIMIINASR
jgi:hypothetical protein